MPYNQFKKINDFELINVANKSNIILQASSVIKSENDQLIKKLLGVWKYVMPNGEQFIARFYIEDNNLRISLGPWATDDGIFGYISNVQYKSANICQLTVFEHGYDKGPYGKVSSSTHSFNIDIKNIDNKKIDNKKIGIILYDSIRYFKKVTDNYNNYDQYFGY